MKGFLHLAPGLRAVHVVSESRINLWDDMEVPEESFHWSSWDSRTCYPRRAFNQQITDERRGITVLDPMSSLLREFLRSQWRFSYKSYYSYEVEPPLMNKESPQQAHFPQFDIGERLLFYVHEHRFPNIELVRKWGNKRK